LVSKCVEIVNGKDSSLIERSLSILRNFIGLYDSELKKREKMQNNRDKDLMSLRIQLDSVNAITLDEISPSETVGDLKRKVSQQIKGNSLTPINLFWEDKELKENNKTLSYYRIDQSSPIFVQKKHPSIVNVVEEIEGNSLVYETLQLAFRALGLRTNISNLNKSSESTPQPETPRKTKKVQSETIQNQSPESLLSTGENFSKLYNLLQNSSENESSSVAMRVWLLLDILPLNNKFLENFTNIEKSVNWEKLIPKDGSIIKKLYPLKVLSEIFSSYKLVNKENWSSIFVETEGLSHLLSIFKNIKDPEIKKESKEQNEEISYFQSILFIQICFQNILSLGKTQLVGDFKKSPKEIIDKILSTILIVSQSHTNEVMQISGDIIESGISVITDLISNDISLLEHFYNFKNFKEW
jgi:hypothetical protein